MAMACGNWLASSLLQESFSSLASSGPERGDGRRVSSSSQLRGLRRSCRAPALSVSEECSSSCLRNLTCHALGSKVQHANAVTDALNQTSDLDTLEGIDWDNFGFGLRPTDFMYVMKGDLKGNWQKGELQPFGNLEISPAAGVLNYGQGVFEGMKAYKTADDRVLMFRPEENALRMVQSAERMSMRAPDVETFVNAVKQTVIANKRWGSC